MSFIKPGDMGHYYAFTAATMSHHLDALSKGNIKEGLAIPKGVLYSAQVMLKEVAIQIKVDREERSYPKEVNPSRLRCLRRLVSDAASRASGEGWGKKLEDQILEFSRLTRDIPEDIRTDRKAYVPLQRLFKEILNISDMYMFETPYKYLVG
ncbi:hypothetical protein HYT23_04270 [Candidatus Pacearchaeota archaeon]|nr:hypothetical protein [Candidatus Pacearchaeota archaeon]